MFWFFRYTNTKDHGALVFQLVDIQDHGATMRHQGLHDKLIEVSVPLDALKKWRGTKSPMPKACDLAMQSRCMPEAHPAFQEEHQRAMVVVALHAAYEKHACNASIAFGQHPSSLFTSCSCKKKAIRLLPMGTIAKHKGKEPTKAIHINAFGHQWTITAPKQNSMFEDDKLPLVPFFWVRPAPSDEEANMAWSVIKQDDMCIPMLVNEDSIATHAVLYHASAEAMKEPPKKKAKSKAKN